MASWEGAQRDAALYLSDQKPSTSATPLVHVAGNAALPSPATSAPSPPKGPRPLSCISCQQRKLKCDRAWPCARCVKSRIQCVPAASVARPRRKRFAERELLDRLRHYEDLMRRHNVSHEPLHPDANLPDVDDAPYTSPAATPASTRPATDFNVPPRPSEAKDLWRAMNQTTGERDGDGDETVEDANPRPDVVRNAAVQQAYDKMYESNDHLLFGAQRQNIDLATLHPPWNRIFKLWQLFLENVHPLLKVVHMPTLQSRIVDAISVLGAVNPVMHALMFSIYSMAIHSVDESTCSKLFDSEKAKLLSSYHFACQQALLSCGVLRMDDREGLTAMFLYLISTRDRTDPRTVSTMLGVTSRLAQRMGLHSEAMNDKCSAFEGEMRRRLWWALVIFDARISDMAGNKAAILLTPIWDCLKPSHLDDSQMWPEMQSIRRSSLQLSSAVFVAVRSEIDDVARNSAFYLDFTNPALKPIARLPEHASFSDYATHIEEHYLARCDPENPTHFMIIWTTRGLLAKYRLLEYYSAHSDPTQAPSDRQRDEAASLCLRMLEADTNLMVSPLTKGYRWLIHFSFPFPAYIHLIQDMRRRMDSIGIQQCWDAMSDNYEARFLDIEPEVGLFHKLIAKLIVRTWMESRTIAHPPHVAQSAPRIVAHVARKIGVTDFSKPAPAEGHSASLEDHQSAHVAMTEGSHDVHEQDAAWQDLNTFCDLSQYGFDFNMNDEDWNAFDMDALFAPS